MPKKPRKVSEASKKVVTAKAKRQSKKDKASQIISVGDEVRLSLRIHNKFSGYDPRQLREDVPSRQIEGLVLSIREVATGQLVPLASGNCEQYVIEVIHNRSFDAAFASTQNAGKVGMGDRPQDGPMWPKAQRALRKIAKERNLVSLGDGSLLESPLNETILDGWRVTKVYADDLELVEQSA